LKTKHKANNHNCSQAIYKSCFKWSNTKERRGSNWYL